MSFDSRLPMERINLKDCASVPKQNRFKLRTNKNKILPCLAMPLLLSKSLKLTQTREVKTFYKAVQ